MLIRTLTGLTTTLKPEVCLWAIILPKILLSIEHPTQLFLYSQFCRCCYTGALLDPKPSRQPKFLLHPEFRNSYWCNLYLATKHKCFYWCTSVLLWNAFILRNFLHNRLGNWVNTAGQYASQKLIKLPLVNQENLFFPCRWSYIASTLQQDSYISKALVRRFYHLYS